jgi:hypothetical protein
MNRSIRIASLLLALAAVSACGEAAQTSEEQSSSTALVTHDNGYVARWATLYLRGTMNNWGTTPMELVGDHEWQLEIKTGNGSDERFKLDVDGSWFENYGDDDGNQVIDRSGKDIAVPASKELIVHVNDESGFFWLEAKTYQANATFVFPEGVDPKALVSKQIKMLVDGHDYGWSYVYGDENGAPYSPICCLEAGHTYSLKVDAIVGQDRLVGEADWSVDGTVDSIPVVLTLAKASLDDYGAVELSVLGDRWENGQMVSFPYTSVGVYLGDWHAGHVLGTTGDDGKVSLMIPAGQQLLSAMVMTSSHSAATGSTTVDVAAGSFVSQEMHFAPLSVVIRAHYDAGMGNALYITGASDYAGNWQTATRMSYDPSNNVWHFYGNLPQGLPFKLVRGPWVEEGTISTSQTTWESGADHTVDPASAYATSWMDIWPTF